MKSLVHQVYNSGITKKGGFHMDLSKSPGITTYADLLKLPEEERWEIIDGVPYLMTPSPTVRHQIVIGNLHLLFGNYLKGKSCRVFFAPLDVRFFAEGKRDDEIINVVQPDLTVICNPDKIDRRGVKGSPDLVIEVLSPTSLRRDKVDKMNLYRKAKVKEYWIVDLEHQSIEIYVFQDDPDQFPEIKNYSVLENPVIQVSLFDNLEINLEEIFTD